MTKLSNFKKGHTCFIVGCRNKSVQPAIVASVGRKFVTTQTMSGKKGNKYQETKSGKGLIIADLFPQEYELFPTKEEALARKEEL